MKHMLFSHLALGAASATASCILTVSWLVSAGWGGRVRVTGLLHPIRVAFTTFDIEISRYVPAFLSNHRELDEWGQIAKLVRDSLFVNIPLSLVLGIGIWVCAVVAANFRSNWRDSADPRPSLPMRTAISAHAALCFAPAPMLYLASGTIEAIPRMAVSLPILILLTALPLFWLARLRSTWRSLYRGALISSAAAVLFAVTIAVSAGSGQPTALSAVDGERPNVLLISIDTLRADHLSCYRYGRQTSPNLDKLAAEGTLFETAISPTSWTVPSHMSLMTGQNPLEHGVRTAMTSLSAETETLAEVLRGNGYRTMAAIAGVTLSAKFGFYQGFDVYDDYSALPLAPNAGNEITSERVISTAMGLLSDWQADYRSQPYFLFVHMWDVHGMYNPPEPYDSLFDPDYDGSYTSEDFWRWSVEGGDIDQSDISHIEALYDGEIRYVDAELGRLFERLNQMGVEDNTLIVVTADHGDEFFEHGHVRHNRTLYDEVLHVPLIFKMPKKLPQGKRIPGLVRLADVSPTILSLAEIQTSPGEFGSLVSEPLLRGTDLSTEMKSDEELTLPARVALGELLGEKPMSSIRTESAKLIVELASGKALEMYDLRTDPSEQVNLVSQDSAAVAALLDAWESLSAELESVGQQLEPKELDDEIRTRLKSLGYIQ